MNLRLCLISLTLISVVADTMLLPFYPHFFESAFGIQSPEHVGLYIAACCVTVMTAFPFWAKVANYIAEPKLWIATQIVAAILALYCWQTTSLVNFWIASQLMLVFKASYLLIYPWVMRLEEKSNHLKVAGLFSVLIHFGGIGGALLGGASLQFLEPRTIYLIMAGADMVQVLICIFLVTCIPVANSVIKQEEKIEPSFKAAFNRNVLHIGLISLLFYFSVFLVRPFFTRYWESVSGIANESLSAVVYAIPAWVALLALAWQRYKQPRKDNNTAITAGLLCCLLGVFIQSAPETVLIILGRIVFGYGLFQVTVRLEVLLFERSTPDRYSADFSKIHFCQNLGVIAASLMVGGVIDQYGLQMPFWLALPSLLITLISFHLLARWPLQESDLVLQTKTKESLLDKSDQALVDFTNSPTDSLGVTANASAKS